MLVFRRFLARATSLSDTLVHSDILWWVAIITGLRIIKYMGTQVRM